MELLGRDTGSVRLPLVRASESVRSTIAALLRDAQIEDAHEIGKEKKSTVVRMDKAGKAGASL
jgi:hypothetical protein